MCVFNIKNVHLFLYLTKQMNNLSDNVSSPFIYSFQILQLSPFSIFIIHLRILIIHILLIVFKICSVNLCLPLPRLPVHPPDLTHVCTVVTAVVLCALLLFKILCLFLTLHSPSLPFCISPSWLSVAPRFLRL